MAETSTHLHDYALCAGVLEASGMAVEERSETYLHALLEGNQTIAQCEAQLIAMLERLHDGS